MDGDAGTRAAAHRNLRRETDKAKAAVVCLLRALRGPRESHSDVVLRLAKASSWQARTVPFDLRMNLGHSDRPPALSRREGPAALWGRRPIPNDFRAPGEKLDSVSRSAIADRNGAISWPI
jgi:hypothetical protein